MIRRVGISLPSFPFWRRASGICRLIQCASGCGRLLLGIDKLEAHLAIANDQIGAERTPLDNSGSNLILTLNAYRRFFSKLILNLRQEYF